MVAAKQPILANGHIVLTVPAEARVWIDDAVTFQTGFRRVFHTPLLQLPHEYRITAVDGDRIETVTVTVDPGETVRLTLLE